MDLRSAFALVSTICTGSVNLLLDYATEDQHGGRDTGEYPVEVSINAVEGMFLYALVRVLKPEVVLEIGCADGCSSVHILAALNANHYGKLISIDIDPASGRMVTPDLALRWELIVGDATQIDLPQADFVFEDAAHDYESTLTVLRHLRLMQPDALISHDYYRHLFDGNVGVKQAFDEVFGDEAIGVHFDDTQTGLGVWLNRSRLK